MSHERLPLLRVFCARPWTSRLGPGFFVAQGWCKALGWVNVGYADRRHGALVMAAACIESLECEHRGPDSEVAGHVGVS